MKAGIAMTVLFVSLLLISEADAQKHRGGGLGGSAGYCPTGTCNPRGGPRANNLGNCKAVHCAGAAKKAGKKK